MPEYVNIFFDYFIVLDYYLVKWYVSIEGLYRYASVMAFPLAAE